VRPTWRVCAYRTPPMNRTLLTGRAPFALVLVCALTATTAVAQTVTSTSVPTPNLDRHRAADTVRGQRGPRQRLRRPRHLGGLSPPHQPQGPRRRHQSDDRGVPRSDIAATDIIEATEYGVGTRVDTDDARSAGPVADGFNDSIRSIRVRGLPGAGRSINFFGAPARSTPTSSTASMFPARPNSILYGFGSPAPAGLTSPPNRPRPTKTPTRSPTASMTGAASVGRPTPTSSSSKTASLCAP